jgi:hypothetical protein
VSVRVELGDLPATIERFGAHAYVISTGAVRPHLLHTAVTLDGGRIAFAASTSVMRNIAERPEVTLLWAPVEPEAMSLVVDGVAAATADGTNIEVRASSAILHARRRGA